MERRNTFFISFFFYIICTLFQDGACVNVYFKLSARNLTNLDGMIGDSSDPYCDVRFNGQVVGKTAIFQNNLNPDWPGVFEISSSLQDHDYFSVHVKDSDSMNADDTIGWAIVSLEQIAEIGTKTIAITHNGQQRGKLIVKTVGVEGTRGIYWNKAELASRPRAVAEGDYKIVDLDNDVVEFTKEV